MRAILLSLLVFACGRDAAPPPPPPAPARPPAAPTAPATPKPRVAIVFKQALTETTLTDEMLLARIQSTYLTGLKACYAAELAKTPDAQGKVVVKLAVAPNGHTRSVEITGFGAALPACVKAEVEGWTFEIPTREGGAVEAPFMLKLLFTPTL